jgi:hypothetical protein
MIKAMSAIAPIGNVQLRVVHTKQVPDGQYDDGMILIYSQTADEVCGGFAGSRLGDVVLAHEIAHVWFGGRVREYGDEAADWSESLAEYAATSALPERGIEARRHRLVGYAKVTEDLVAMSQRLDRSAQLSYGRGMLLLTALEDRVGLDAMRAMMRDFISMNTGKLGSWDAVVDSIDRVLGSQHATWFRSWLDRANAPDLRLRAARRTGARLRAELVQTSEPPFVGAVWLVFTGGKDKLATHRVEFSTAVTPIDLPVPPGADALHIDPESRLPRKIAPGTSDEAGTMVPLTAAARPAGAAGR